MALRRNTASLYIQAFEYARCLEGWTFDALQRKAKSLQVAYDDLSGSNYHRDSPMFLRHRLFYRSFPEYTYAAMLDKLHSRPPRTQVKKMDVADICDIIVQIAVVNNLVLQDHRDTVCQSFYTLLSGGVPISLENCWRTLDTPQKILYQQQKPEPKCRCLTGGMGFHFKTCPARYTERSYSYMDKVMGIGISSPNATPPKKEPERPLMDDMEEVP